MAIVQNRSTEIGDVIVIKTGIPIIGIVTLTGFLDDVSGESVNRYFSKKFRYSIDGINFSDYLDLNEQNIAAIDVIQTDTFVIEYYYTRAGVDPTNTLAFNSVTLEGQFQELECGPAFKNSMLYDFLGDCNTICTLNWSINVLEKLYKRGLLPAYMERGATQSTTEDRDFIDFWRSITHYFAYYVCLARKFSKFHTDENLLQEFLLQRELFLCSHDTSYQDLIYLTSNYLDEIRQRGTMQIVKKRKLISTIDESISLSASASLSASNNTSSLPDASLKQVDGELLRLICYDDDCDEFLFNVNKTEHLGWNIGNSSPMYRGQILHNNLNKAYEDSTADLSQYPTTGTSNLSIVTDGGEKVIKITGGIGDSGIGGYLSFNKAIVINRSLDYEITFQIKQSQLGGKIRFGVVGYDISGNIVNLRKISSASYSNTFFEITQLNRTDKYYFVRGIIYGKTRTTANTEIIPHIGYGEHLKFIDGSISKIVPQIILTAGVGEIRVKNLHIKPLATPFSNGFIQTRNMIHVWMNNRNNKLTNEELEDNMRRYLIPYNSTFKNIYLAQEECVVDTADISLSQSLSNSH
jgi:hypothetical protein